MNAYQWKQEARRQRLERAADRARDDSDQSFRGADAAVAGIPFGQPILVGHHSEKRHRRALQRCDDRMRKGLTRLREAEDYARRAAAVGQGGISSDDPEAVDKLGDKAQQLRAQRDRMKAINSAWRKAKGARGWSLGLDLTQHEADDIASTARAQPFYNGVPYPPYALTNIGARIRDAEKRTQQLQHLAERVSDGPTGATVNGVGIVTDPGENRVTLTFPRRLSRDEYKRVRSFGFVWSPTRDGFTRKMGGTSGAEYAAKMLVEGFHEVTP